MTKHLDKLGSFDDFKFSSLLTAEEPDMEKLRRYVFGLLTDKARAQDARDEAKGETEAVQEKLDEAKTELSKKGDPDLAKELEKSQAKVKELEGTISGFETDKLRAEVAEEKGLTPRQAKYLQGTTKDELEASADEYIKDNDIEVRDPDADPDDDEADTDLRTRPRSTARNPLDPKPGADSTKEIDYDAVAARIVGRSFI